VTSLDEFTFGRAVHPVSCGRGVVCGKGTVIPEINFTLPSNIPTGCAVSLQISVNGKRS